MKPKSEHYSTAFDVPLLKVNFNGPSLELTVAFSIAGSTPEAPSQGSNDIQGIQSKIWPTWIEKGHILKIL
jgi:hypothetical protein